ncbi:MAG: hypothetical protein BGO51_27240 [Rhodospirillales bacterium 69-11]|nr:MAG: hypothetical protein BGO51_27240 [Rhodospirillales bacterium 69-11]
MTSGRLSYRDLLRDVAVRRLLAATALARIAGRMFLLTVVLLALDAGGDPGFVGWVSFAALAPGLLSSPLSGALLDRMGAGRAILLDMACSAALALALAGAGGTPAALIALVAAFSLTSPLSQAGIRTLLPHLVAPALRDRANAMDTLIHGVVDILGPPLAGVLVAVLGARATLLPISVLYAAAAICLRGLDTRPVGGARSLVALLRQAGEGVSSVVRMPTLRGLVASYAAYEIAWGIMIVAVPVLVSRHVGEGPARDTTTGLLWAGLGGAGIVGALLAGHWRAVGRERALIATGMAVTGMALGSAGLAMARLDAGLPALALGLVMMGAMAGPIDVSVLTLRQRRTPPDRLGRVMAVSMSLNQSGAPLGAALGGWLLTQAADATLPAAALAACLGAVACWRLIPPERAGAYREMRQEEEAGSATNVVRPTDLSPGGPSSGGSSC